MGERPVRARARRRGLSGPCSGPRARSTGSRFARVLGPPPPVFVFGSAVAEPPRPPLPRRPSGNAPTAADRRRRCAARARPRGPGRRPSNGRGHRRGSPPPPRTASRGGSACRARSGRSEAATYPISGCKAPRKSASSPTPESAARTRRSRLRLPPTTGGAVSSRSSPNAGKALKASRPEITVPPAVATPSARPAANDPPRAKTSRPTRTPIAAATRTKAP